MDLSRAYKSYKASFYIYSNAMCLLHISPCPNIDDDDEDLGRLIGRLHMRHAALLLSLACCTFRFHEALTHQDAGMNNAPLKAFR